MLKIFMTGDNHIGLKYSHHEKAETIISKRLEAFDNMVIKANKEDCGLFVVTGDLFENNSNILKKHISAVIKSLSAFKGYVAILPGNHDYYDKKSKLWQQFSELSKVTDNIIVLTDFKKYTLNINDEEVVLYPALCQTSHSAAGENNLGWIKDEGIISDSTYRIGIAHGAVEGETIDSEGAYFLMTRDELYSIPVDVWLIGHTHVPFPNNLSETEYKSGERIFNAGAHVQPNVSCNTDGECFIITIDENKQVCAKKYVSGNLRFFRKKIALAAGDVEKKLADELKECPDDSVVDLILSGAVSLDEYDRRDELVKSALSRFIEGTYSDYELTKLISEELVKAEFAETSFSAQFLSALLDKPKEAQLAYELLKQLKEEK